MQRLFSGVATVLLLGCSSVPITSGTALAQAAAESGSEPQGRLGIVADPVADDGQLMFEIMIAEMAGRRGQLDIAMTGYLRASERTDDPRVSDRAARLAMFGRQWAEAEKAARRWLLLEPDAAEVNEILAQALLRQDKTEEAVDVYIVLMNKAPNQSALMQQIQAELQSLENPPQALAAMSSLVENFPDNAESHLGLARMQAATGDNSAALSSVQNALSLDSGNASALLLQAQLRLAAGEGDDAFAGIESALTENPERPALRLAYVQLLVEARQLDGIDEQFDRLVADSPDDADLLLTVSLLALDSRRIDRAEIYLGDLLETGEYADQANFYLGRISDQRGDYQQALNYLEQVQSGDLQLNAQISIAEILSDNGKLEQGRQRLHQIAAGVEDPRVKTQLLTSESRMLQLANQPSVAVMILSEGLQQYPDNPDLLYARALAADSAGNQSMLIDDLDALIALEPENAHALNALGYHYADSNTELEKAEVLLVKANSLLPNDPAIMDSLGWLRYRQGNYAEATELLQRAYALFPDPEIASHLGETLWLDGKQDAARAIIEEALVENPDNDDLMRVLQQYFE